MEPIFKKILNTGQPDPSTVTPVVQTPGSVSAYGVPASKAPKALVPEPRMPVMNTTAPASSTSVAPPAPTVPKMPAARVPKIKNAGMSEYERRRVIAGLRAEHTDLGDLNDIELLKGVHSVLVEDKVLPAGATADDFMAHLSKKYARPALDTESQAKLVESLRMGAKDPGAHTDQELLAEYRKHYNAERLVAYHFPTLADLNPDQVLQGSFDAQRESGKIDPTQNYTQWLADLTHQTDSMIHGKRALVIKQLRAVHPGLSFPDQKNVQTGDTSELFSGSPTTQIEPGNIQSWAEAHPGFHEVDDAALLRQVRSLSPSFSGDDNALIEHLYARPMPTDEERAAIVERRWPKLAGKMPTDKILNLMHTKAKTTKTIDEWIDSIREPSMIEKTGSFLKNLGLGIAEGIAPIGAAVAEWQGAHELRGEVAKQTEGMAAAHGEPFPGSEQKLARAKELEHQANKDALKQIPAALGLVIGGPVTAAVSRGLPLLGAAGPLLSQSAGMIASGAVMGGGEKVVEGGTPVEVGRSAAEGAGAALALGVGVPIAARATGGLFSRVLRSMPKEPLAPKITVPSPVPPVPTAVEAPESGITPTISPAEQMKLFGEQPTAPAITPPAPVAKLPSDLAGAKPRYGFGQKQFELQFNNDVDMAAYITAQATKSSRDAEYRAFLHDQGMTDPQIAARGRQVKATIKIRAKGADPEAGPLTIQSHEPVRRVAKPVAVPEATPATSAPLAAGTPTEGTVGQGPFKPTSRAQQTSGPIAEKVMREFESGPDHLKSLDESGGGRTITELETMRKAVALPDMTVEELAGWKTSRGVSEVDIARAGYLRNHWVDRYVEALYKGDEAVRTEAYGVLQQIEPGYHNLTSTPGRALQFQSAVGLIEDRMNLIREAEAANMPSKQIAKLLDEFDRSHAVEVGQVKRSTMRGLWTRAEDWSVWAKLTSPITHGVNSVSNAFNVVQRGIEKQIEAGALQGMGRAGEAEAARRFAFPTIQGWKDGFRVYRDALKKSIDEADEGMRQTSEGKFERPKLAPLPKWAEPMSARMKSLKQTRVGRAV